MEKNHLLEGKRILIVDDEPDVLETLADLLTICVVKTIDSLTPLGNQTRLDSWKAIRELVINYLEKTKGRFPLREIKREHTGVQRVFDKGAKEIREALAELSNIRDSESKAQGEQDAAEASPDE